MSRVRTFFLEEATECLRIAREEVTRDIPDRSVVHRAVRRLRGSAQLARYPTLAREARVLESRTRPEEGNGWTAALAEETVQGLAALEDGVEAVREGRIEPGEETGNAMEGEATDPGMIGIEELEYRGAAALERAMELRTALEDAVVSEAPVGPIIDELFDLIRLGMG